MVQIDNGLTRIQGGKAGKGDFPEERCQGKAVPR